MDTIIERTRCGRGAVAVLAMLMAIGAAAGPGACMRAGAQSPTPAGVEVDAAAAEALRAAGRDASLAVLPTEVVGRAMPQVGEVVALLLERGGMTHLELPESTFTAPSEAGPAAAGVAFGAFVREHPVASDFALFTDFGGSSATGFESVTALIVDRQGRVAWCDRAAKGDAAFDRARIREPMDACVFVVERLRPALNLGDPRSGSAPAGPIAERMRRAGGVPDSKELDAIAGRTKAFCAKRATATIAICPTRVNGAFSEESAATIARELAAAHWTVPAPTADGPRAPRPSTMNQQQVAWSLARELSAWTRTHAPDAEYALMADYLIGEKGVLGVQFAICDRKGEIVMVDVQNDHQKAFKSIAPRDAAQCDRLVAQQVKALCK